MSITNATFRRPTANEALYDDRVPLSFWRGPVRHPWACRNARSLDTGRASARHYQSVVAAGPLRQHSTEAVWSPLIRHETQLPSLVEDYL